MEHLIVSGGEQYLGFARSRIRALHMTGMRYASQTFIVEDIRISVRICDEHDYINISGGYEANYQFFTTRPLRTVEALGRFSVFRGYGTAISVNTVTGTIKHSPTGATEEADTQTPERWPYIPNALEMSKGFRRHSPWQIQGVSERVFYPKDPLTSPKFSVGVAAYPCLFSVWSPTSPLKSLSIKGSYVSGSINGADPSAVDQAYDTAPVVFSNSSVNSPNKFVPDADWYRQAATCVVTSSDPEIAPRRFIILVDTSNTFHAYPTTEVDDTLLEGATADWPGQYIKTNVPEEFVKRVDAPFPAWCRTSAYESRSVFAELDVSISTERFLRDVPQHKWFFNSTATKVCSVVFEDLPAFSLYGTSAGIKPYRVVGGVQEEIIEALPGLLEFSLNIELTGNNPEDFTFGMTVATVLRPTTDKKFVMACEYGWAVPEMQRLDDLIAMIGEIHHASDVRISPGPHYLNIRAARARVLVNNLTTNVTLRVFLVNGTNQLYTSRSALGTQIFVPEGVPAYRARGYILAFDLRVLAFVVQQQYSEQAVFTGDMEGIFTSVGRVLTYMANALVDTKVMDPSSALNTALVAVFSDTSPGAYLYPVDDYGTHLDFGDLAADFSAYSKNGLLSRDYFSGKLSEYINVLGDMQHPGLTYWAGAYYYNLFVAKALTPAHTSFFNVHPNGSWSILTGPIFYYAGPAGHATPKSALSASHMKQTQVDIISLSYMDAANKKKKAVTTTHLEAFNKAYDKTYTESDYLCTFALDPDSYSMTARSASGVSYFSIGNDPPYTWNARNTSSAYNVFRTLPILGGSQCFF